MSNVYYHPERHGLTVVAELEDPQACYDYDTIVVWEDAEGKRYWATDSGCSCPTPFEDFASVHELNDNFDELDNYLDSGWFPRDRAQLEIIEFRRKL